MRQFFFLYLTSTQKVPLDVRKFKKDTGWEPVYTFEETMYDLLNYWRERIQNPENLLVR